MISSAKLVKPSIEYMNSFIEACREFAKVNPEYDVFQGEIPTPERIDKLLKQYEDQSRGIGLPKGWVPSTTFWLVDGDEYIGSGNIRHALTEHLKQFGGHIGYNIRPSKWGLGYGTWQLKLLLPEAAKLGIRYALITCSSRNIASRRVIEKNGGVYIDCVKNIYNGQEWPTLRFRVDTGLKEGSLYTSGEPWYHGSNMKFDTLLPGSTITQWRELAEAFSHKPSLLEYDDDKAIRHNGTQPGYLYVIDEPIVPGDDIYIHPRSAMDQAYEWLTVRPLKLRLIPELPV